MSCFNKRLHKLLTFASFFAFTSALCLGQSSYKGLTPGSSTRADVDRVLGQPQKQISPTLAEYGGGRDATKIYVQFADESVAAASRASPRPSSSTAVDRTPSLFACLVAALAAHFRIYNGKRRGNTRIGGNRNA